MKGADAYIGKPWQLGAVGPHAYDCWGLVRAALGDLFGIHVPELAAHLGIGSVAQTPVIAQAALRTGHWTELAAPTAGAVVAFYDIAGNVRHVGLCLWADTVLHTRRGAGARLDCLRLVEAGWEQGRYYQWAP
jgi:cell wall-associated NlpC family hydrolase